MEQQKKDARAGAKADFEKNKNFDPDKYFKVKFDTKHSRHRQDIAVKKKMSMLQKNASAVAKQAELQVGMKRNQQLTASELSDIIIRLIINGSFEYTDTTLYWYPTMLDIVRMFDLTINIPVECFLTISANDDVAPAEDPEFKRDTLTESFESVTNGELAFDDVRDIIHTAADGSKQYFPLAKPTRWQTILNRFKPKKVPLMSFSRFMRNRTFGINGETWEGRTGRVLMKFLSRKNGKDTYNVITVDGLVLIYSGLNYQTPLTAFFMTPSSLAERLRYAVNGPQTISINMIRRTFLNIVDLKKEAGQMFYQQGGSRRYIQ